VAALPFAVSFDPYVLSIFTAALPAAAAALAWNLLASGCGQVSFGHAAFFGIGAYASAASARAGLSPFAAMPLGGVVGAAAALFAGPPLFRFRGASFAMAMFVLAEAAKVVCRNLGPLTGGAGGLYGIPPLPAVEVSGLRADFGASRAAAYWLASALPLLTGACALAVARSPAGFRMAAVAQDEEAAAAMGVAVLRVKTGALCLSGFLTALAGAFYAHSVGFLTPDSAFDGRWSLLPIVASLLGGMHTLAGPAAGALALAALDEFLFKPLVPSGHRMFFGLLLAALVAYRPSGLFGPRAARLRGAED